MPEHARGQLVSTDTPIRAVVIRGEYTAQPRTGHDAVRIGAFAALVPQPGHDRRMRTIGSQWLQNLREFEFRARRRRHPSAHHRSMREVDESEVRSRLRRRLRLTDRDAVHQAHSYDVPEIIALPIAAGSPNYLEWIAASVR